MFCSQCGSGTSQVMTPVEQSAATQQTAAVVSPRIETGPEHEPATAPLPARRTSPGARAWIILAGVAAAAIAVTAIILIRGGDQPTQGSAATPSTSNTSGDSGTPAPLSDVPGGGEETRSIALTELAVPEGAGRCFGPRPGAYIRFNGVRYEQNFLQCGNRSGDLASGRFVVDLTSVLGDTPARITGFSATVGIDEESDGDSSGAAWTVTYGGKVLCVAVPLKGSPETCEASGLNIPVVAGGAKLIMEQEMPTANSARSLWAAFHQPTVTVAVGGASGSG